MAQSEVTEFARMHVLSERWLAITLLSCGHFDVMLEGNEAMMAIETDDPQSG